MPDYSQMSPVTSHATLPRLVDYHSGNEAGNGIVEKLPNGGHHLQYVPSDHPKYWARERNKHLLNIKSTQNCHLPYNNTGEMLYTTNNRNFRTPDNFEKSKPGLMSLGCSHTYGVGVRDHEAWPQRVATALNLPNWNLGSGGQSVDYCIWVARAFFDKGYIPKAVAVWWPDLYRTIILPDTANHMEEDIISTVIHGEQASTVPKEVFTFAPMDTITDAPTEIQMVVKGHFAKSMIHILSEFLIKREYLILLCKAHNVPIVEYNKGCPEWTGSTSIAQAIDEKTTYPIPKVILVNPTDQGKDYEYYRKINKLKDGEYCPDIFYETARDGMHHSGTFMKEVADRFELSFKQNYIRLA